MLFQAHLARVIKDMVDDVAVCIIDNVVRLPIIGPVDIEVMAQKISLKGLCGTKLTNGEDVGFHIIHDSADAFVLALRVVVGFKAVGKTTLMVAIIQEVVLHHGECVLGFGRDDNPC